MAMNYVIEKEKPDFEVRTDLALEERESFPGDGGEIAGVSLREWQDKEKQVKLTEVKILDERGAKAMGKPEGTYLTLEADQLAEKDENYHEQVSQELARHVRRLIGHMVKGKERKILVVGLGNLYVTPDALGPKAVEHLQVTRHLEQQYGEGFCREKGLPVLSGIVPGVMAQTGMETAEILKGIIQETKPDLLIAIDALAARSTRRLSRTIQITDTGINPGSGVGNHRHGLSKETVGIPVIAIGVPTVVDAATIVSDTMQTLIQAMEEHSHLSTLSTGLNALNDMEKYELIRELLSPQLNTMFVTPKDIDESVKRLSYTLSEGLNIAFA